MQTAAALMMVALMWVTLQAFMITVLAGYINVTNPAQLGNCYRCYTTVRGQQTVV